VSSDLLAVLELDDEHGVLQRFPHRTFNAFRGASIASRSTIDISHASSLSLTEWRIFISEVTWAEQPGISN